MDRQLEDDVPDDDYDDKYDDDNDDDHDDEHDDDHDDDHDYNLVVVLRIGSWGMASGMREREVKRTVWPLQSIHWS